MKLGQKIKVISPECSKVVADNGRVGTITDKVGGMVEITFPYSGDIAWVKASECVCEEK